MMFIYLDKYGNQLEDITFIELSWNRKANEAGSFTLMSTASFWNPEIKYIKNVGRKETAMVQKIVFEKKEEGNFITASGFFIEKALDWACNYFAKNISTKNAASSRSAIESLMREDFNSAYKQLHIISLASDSVIPTSINQTVEVGAGFGTFLYGILEPLGYSIWCEPVFSSDDTKPLLGLIVHTYKGEDKRNDVYFGEGYNDVSKIDYTMDESAEYPYYGIIQEIEEPSGFSGVTSVWTSDGTKHYITERYIEEANMPTQLGATYPLKVIEGGVSDVEMVSSNQGIIREAMRQQARLDMLDNYKVETITADVIQNNFLYLKDYDMGDVCTVVIDDVEQLFVARIVEVEEVHRNNTMEVTLTLGTPQKSKYRRIKIL